jgi:hypothetical protein
MLDRSAGSPSPGPPPDPPSLWRELADGTAGPIVRSVVSLALGGALAAAALALSFLLAAMVPGWSYDRRGGPSPTDELLASLLALTCLAYIGALVWIWTRTRARPKHEFWRATWMSLLVVASVAVFGFFIDTTDAFRGAFDVLMSALLLLGGAVVLMIWLQAARRFAQGRPLRDPDGLLDVRCPTCGYRMVGLHESRCPECGTAYTLDDLLARQEFVTRKDRERNFNTP